MSPIAEDRVTSDFEVDSPATDLRPDSPAVSMAEQQLAHLVEQIFIGNKAALGRTVGFLACDSETQIKPFCERIASILSRAERSVVVAALDTVEPNTGIDHTIALLDQSALFDLSRLHSYFGVVLVLTANKTRRAVAVRLRDQLREAGVRVLGSVLVERSLPIPESLYRRI